MNTEDQEKVTEEESAAEQAEEEEPIPPAKEPESAKKKKIKRIAFYTVTLTLAVVVSALLSLTVFFKIDEIYVEGTKRYPENDIIAASMIEKNENLLLCNTSPGEKNIIAKFPYVEDVSIQKKLFNKIAIKITEAKPFLMIRNGERYFVLSKKGKIIEINDENKYNDVPMIVGAKLKKTKLCDYSEYESENTKKYLDEVVSLVRKYEIKDISTVDVTSMTNIFLLKKNGFKLIIGAPENLDYKFRSAVSIMEHISETDSGVLDVSMVDAEGAKSYFKSKDTGKAESSKPAEESKQEVSKTESSLVEESTAESESETSEEENSDDEYYEEENSDDGYYEEENSDDEYYEEENSDEEYYEEENSNDEYYEDEDYGDEDEYSEDEYEEDNENDDDGGDEEEYTDENDSE